MYDEGGTSYYEGDWKDHVRHGKGYRKYRCVRVCVYVCVCVCVCVSVITTRAEMDIKFTIQISSC